MGPTYSCEKCCFCLHDYILYSTPNWYALVKSCISVNHYVLLVRRHLKYDTIEEINVDSKAEYTA